MSINEKYSFKDFTGQTFLDIDSDEFSNSEIKGSCFYQENEPNKIVFPAGMIGVQFQRCNLDNVLMLPISTIDGRCSNRKIMVQNDLQDWVVDMAMNPIEPVNLKHHIKVGLNINPINIPAAVIREVRVTKTKYDAATNWTARATRGNRPVSDVDFWFKEKPAIIETETVEETIEVREWNGTDKLRFDSLPVVVENVLVTPLGVLDVILEVGKVDTVCLRGMVTYYLIRGKAWRYRGE